MNDNKNTLGVISIVLGILGFFAFAIPFGIIGLILGFAGWEKTASKIGVGICAFDLIMVLIYYISY